MKFNKIDVWNKFDKIVKYIYVNSWRRDDSNAIEFIDVIEKAIENTIKRAIYAFVIEINKYDDFADVVINLNVIEEVEREIHKLMWLFSFSTKRYFDVLSNLI